MTLVDLCPGAPCDTCPMPPIAKTVCQSHKNAIESLKTVLANGDPVGRMTVEMEIMACYSLTIHHAVALGLASYNGHALPLLGDIAEILGTTIRKCYPETVEALKEKLDGPLHTLLPTEGAAKKEPVH